MKENYMNKVTLMIDNFEQMKKPFKWEYELTRHLIALSHAVKGKTVDVELVESMKSYIKQHTGTFSPFRGNMLMAMAGVLSAGDKNPRDMFDQMLEDQTMLKNSGFKSSTYLPTALYAFESLNIEGNKTEFVERAYEIYRDMRQKHPFLTGGDDYALALLLADTDHDAQLLEEYYNALNHSGFTKSNGLQMMSHILAFSGREVRDALDHCSDIYDHMKAEKLKVTADYYPALGLVSLLDIDSDELATDMVEVASYLRAQKKYKWLGKGMNILMASAIITSEYIEQQAKESLVSSALTVSIEAILAAQQAAMIAAISASAAASAAAN